MTLKTGNVSQTSFRVRLPAVQGHVLILGHLPGAGPDPAGSNTRFTDASVEFTHEAVPGLHGAIVRATKPAR